MWTYTPFAAYLFEVLTFFSLNTLAMIWSFTSLSALIYVFYKLVNKYISPKSRYQYYQLLPLLVLITPVIENFTFYQVNILNFLIVVLEVFFWKGKRYRGLGIALVAGIKTIPIVYLIFFLFDKDFRAFWRSIFFYLVTFIIGFIALPSQSAVYFKEKIFINIGRQIGKSIYYSNNHSIMLILDYYTHRLIPMKIYLPIVLLSFLVLVTLAFLFYKKNDLLLSFSIIALFTILFSPVSWNHHAVFLIAPLLFIFRESNIHTWYKIVLLLTQIVLSIPTTSNFNITFWQIFSLCNLFILLFTLFVGFRKHYTRNNL